jgi:BirA family biotin operon repressor/biotin-[acetyl-CoA-carboxylase] ligase
VTNQHEERPGERRPFTPPAEWTALAAVPAGWSAFYVDETGSTNTDLSAAASAGAPDHTVLMTGHQTAGRGRLERRWDAPPGANLLVSILFREVTDQPNELTRRVGLAVIDAAARTGTQEAQLKWPNDVLLDGRKLAGVLAQRNPDGSVVVGLGLNVGWAPEGAARLGPELRPVDLLVDVLAALDVLSVVPDGERDSRYRAVLATLGSRVRVELPGNELVGRAVDIDADGRLVVLDDCAISHHVSVGDIIHLRADRQLDG